MQGGGVLPYGPDNSLNINNTRTHTHTRCSNRTTNCGSLYDPHNLCSGDIVRVRHALHALLDSPQNNLKVCVGGQVVYDRTTSKIQLEHNHWANGAIIDDSPYSSVMVPEVVSSILSSEAVLPLLQEMQALDILEPEGAAIVFARLKRLLKCDSSHAEMYISQQALRVSATGDAVVLEAARAVKSWLGTAAATATATATATGTGTGTGKTNTTYATAPAGVTPKTRPPPAPAFVVSTRLCAAAAKAALLRQRLP